MNDLLDIPAHELEALLLAATPEERVEIQRLLAYREAMASPAGFAARVSGGTFLRPRHVELINTHLVALAEGRIRKLIITLPPRYGKSELCSKYLPAWFLSRWPNRKVILASYEASFAESWGGLARDALLDATEWTGVEARDDSKSRREWRIKGHTGVMYSAGRGGRTTGMGAHLFIIDDPFKNSQEADSEVIRQETWNWYLSVANTRMENPPEWAQHVTNGAQLVIHTRWHEDDLIGRLLESQPGQWTVINLPAIAEDDDDALGRQPGEPLWPEMFSLASLEQTRQDLIAGEGIRWWWALYQQRPTGKEGDEFDMTALRYFDVVPTGEGPALSLNGRLVPLRRMFRFGTMDVAMSLKTRADWTVASSWAATRDYPTDLCWLDVMRKRVQSGGQLDLVRAALDKHDLQYMGIEDKTFGTNLLQEAARARLAVRPIPVETDKVTRAQPAAKVVRANRLWLPREAMPWRDIVESEMTAFPNGKHDDCVDTLSSAAILVESRRMGKKPKDAPLTDEERVQKYIKEKINKGRKSRSHPVLGRI